MRELFEYVKAYTKMLGLNYDTHCLLKAVNIGIRVAEIATIANFDYGYLKFSIRYYPITEGLRVGIYTDDKNDDLVNFYSSGDNFSIEIIKRK